MNDCYQLPKEKEKIEFLQEFITTNYKTLRKLAKLSTTEMAFETGVTRQTINSIENGNTFRINRALLITTKYMLLERRNIIYGLHGSFLTCFLDVIFKVKNDEDWIIFMENSEEIGIAFKIVLGIIESSLYQTTRINLCKAVFGIILDNSAANFICHNCQDFWEPL